MDQCCAPRIVAAQPERERESQEQRKDRKSRTLHDGRRILAGQTLALAGENRGLAAAKLKSHLVHCEDQDRRASMMTQVGMDSEMIIPVTQTLGHDLRPDDDP